MQRINKQPIYLNFKRQNKWLGIIDYKSLSILLGYVFVLGYILSILPISLESSVYIFIFLTIPVIALFCVNLNNESIIQVIFTIVKFMSKNKIYLDMDRYKENSKEIYIKEDKQQKV